MEFEVSYSIYPKISKKRGVGMECKRSVSHPGIYLLDAIDALGMTVDEFGNRVDIPPKILAKLIDGKTNITMDIASKLSLFFETGVEVWMSIQARYDTFNKFCR